MSDDLDTATRLLTEQGWTARLLHPDDPDSPIVFTRKAEPGES